MAGRVGRGGASISLGAVAGSWGAQGRVSPRAPDCFAMPDGSFWFDT